MQTIGIVLNVGEGQSDAFERGFREMEAPIWADLHRRGLLTMATLSRLDISTKAVGGAVQYLVVAIFATTRDITSMTRTPASRLGTRERTRTRSMSRTSSEATAS